MKNQKIDLNMYSAVEIYEFVLVGKIPRFPANFWSCEWSYDYAREIGIYLINKELQNSDVMIKKFFGTNFLIQNKLKTVLNLFNGVAYNYFEFLYPNRLKPWEFKVTPKNFWTDETAKIAVEWMIDEKLKWGREEIIDRISLEIFSQFGLLGLLKRRFNSSIFSALDHAFPNKFKRWEMVHVPPGFWDDIENIRSAVQWMVSEKLNGNIDILMQNLTISTFNKNGLGGLVSYYKRIPYELMVDIFPYDEWQTICTIKKQVYKRDNEALET